LEVTSAHHPSSLPLNEGSRYRLLEEYDWVVNNKQPTFCNIIFLDRCDQCRILGMSRAQPYSSSLRNSEPRNSIMGDIQSPR